MIPAIQSHRTVRRYKSDPIPEETLTRILEAGTRASNTGNMQLYSLIVTTDPAVKEELAPLHFNQPMVTQAPVVITFCADIHRFSLWCRQRGAEPRYDNFVWFVNAAIDSLLASENVALAAEDEGLGICYLGTTAYNADQIIQILSLPRLVVPIVTVTVGYPDGLPEQVERLPLQAVVHHETYADYTPAIIDELYRDKEALEVNKQFVRENQKETLAQVFTDVRYTKANNEHFSDVLLNVLKEQGFLK